MTDLPPLRSARPSLSPAARALRLQRIFARLQEGASYAAIATEEGLSRERLRQIVKAAATRRGSPADHKKMQFARLAPALRLAASGVAEGDMKAIPLLLKLVDRLDRYCDPDGLNATPQLGDLFPRGRRRRPQGGLKLPVDEDAGQAIEAQISRESAPTP